MMKFTSIITQSLILSGISLYTSSFSNITQSGSSLLGQQALVETAQAMDLETRQLCKNVPSGSLFARTELFFGLGKPDGSEVTEGEFQRFLNQEITPRFPDGLTLLAGRGQFKNASGAIVKEPSKLLILLYPMGKLTNSSQKVEQIRRAYKTAFQQESVLRTDERSCVSF